MSDRGFGDLASSSWNQIIDAIPAEMPGVYAEYVESDDEATVETLAEERRDVFAINNAFIVTCTLLMIFGLLGQALMAAGVPGEDPIWFSLVRVGAIFGVTLLSFIVFGFSLAFPGDGLFGGFYLPGDLNSVEYGLSGIHEWTDLFYIGCYVALIGVLILSFCRAGLSSISGFLIAIPIVTLLSPLVVSWKWGAGWLDQLGNNYDFAGSALFHWHAGFSALILGGSLTLYRNWREKELPTKPEEKPAAFNPLLFIPGALGMILLMVGMNAGSALEATAPVVAPVIQASLIAGAISGFLAIVWWAVARTRTVVEYLVHGFIAGMVVAAGGTDLMSLSEAITLGVVSGILVPGFILALDKMRWVDPLAVGPVHGVGGFIGTLGTVILLAEDNTATLLGQMLLLFVIPILSGGLVLLIVVFAGATKLLLTNLPQKSSPPPLPGSP